MQHVKKGFGENEVLKDISLSVAEGEVVSIIGPSGSGKSTLLRCATLLEQMDDGSLTYMGEKAAESINGKTVYAKPADLKKIQRHFGLVFQNFNLFPHYSVLKISLMPRLVFRSGKRRGCCRSKGITGEDGIKRQGRCLSMSAFRRTAAEGIHCAGTCHAAGNIIL